MVLLELQGIDKRQPHTSQGHQDWHFDNVLCECIIRTLSLVTDSSTDEAVVKGKEKSVEEEGRSSA